MMILLQIQIIILGEKRRELRGRGREEEGEERCT